MIQEVRGSCLTRFDNASVDQLLNLATDSGVLQMILEGVGIALCLLQNLLHNGIRHDVLGEKKIEKTSNINQADKGVQRTAISGSRMARSSVSS